MTWESLLDKLAQVWDKIIGAVQVWLDTAPAYIQDLVTRYTHLQITKGIILSSCWFMIMIALITLATYLIRRAINKEDRYDDTSWYRFAGTMVSIFATICLVITVEYILWILWYVYTPELYIISDLSSFFNR